MSAVNENKESNVTSIERPARKKNAKGNRSTGPTSAEGKIKASGNATDHGCTCSLPVANGELTPEAEARIVLPDENRADWEAVKRNWLETYEPETILRRNLVLGAAVADWLMRRNMRRYNDVEQRLYTEQPDATLWNAEQHTQLERFLRYLGKAERTFYRVRNAIEQLRREEKRDGEKAEAGEAKPQPTVSSAKAQSAKAPADGTKAVVSEDKAERSQPGAGTSLIQCITVQVLDGKTCTVFQPRSENLARIISSADEPKPMVKRALYFLHGIPDEYEWVTEYEDHNGRPHVVITRTSAEALQDLERERLHGNGHVLRIG